MKTTNEFSRLKERKNSLTEKKMLIESQLTEKEKLIKVIKEDLSLIEKTEKTIKELEEKELDLSIFFNALEATQSELRATLIETINEALNEIWPKLYPYKDIESVKINVSDKDYEINVKVNNKTERVEGILSGGERTAVALAIRVAFSLVLARNLSMLILDEPTHNLDIETTLSLTEMLRTHLPELVNQIFLITHDKQMEKAASAKLYRLERKKEEFEPTQVIELELK